MTCEKGWQTKEWVWTQCLICVYDIVLVKPRVLFQRLCSSKKRKIKTNSNMLNTDMEKCNFKYNSVNYTQLCNHVKNHIGQFWIK